MINKKKIGCNKPEELHCFMCIFERCPFYYTGNETPEELDWKEFFQKNR